MTTVTDSNQDEFLKEVLSLFAIEARELLAHVKEALADLERGVGAQRQGECIQAVRTALTTLGGSAATAGLAEVEQVAFALLPSIDQFRLKGAIVSGDRLACLKAAVGAIEQAARQLADGGDGAIQDLVGLLKQIAQAESNGPPAGTGNAGLRLRDPSKSPLDVLRDLRQRQEASAGLSRHLVDAVLKRAQESSQTSGTSPDARTIKSLLREIDATDEWFLTEVQTRLPDVLEGFARVKAGDSTPEDADKVTEDVTQLQAAASKADAAAILQFFQGLHVFLRITSQKRIAVNADRFQTVQARLGMIHRLVQRWVQLGQQERLLIERSLTDAGLLPA